MGNYNLHLFKINKKGYCFNCITYDIINISDNMFEIFDLFIKNNKIISDNKKNIKDFLDLVRLNKGFFNKQIEVYENNNAAPIFSFCPAHNCNFKCKYCFAKEKSDYNQKEISIDTVENIFQFMVNKFNTYENFRLEFVSGGEPLLNFGAIKHACKLAKKLSKQKKINFRIILVTNGSLLTDEIISFLNFYNVFLGVSFEGTEKNQNTLRAMKNKNNSYNTVVSNIKKINSQSKYENLKNNLWTISVITSYCESLIDIIENNMEIGIKSMELRIARGNENNDVYVNKKNIQHFRNLYFELYEYLTEHIKNNRYDVFKLILNNYDSFGKLIKKIICDERVFRRCGAGSNKLAFAANGDIYPCDSFVGHEDFLIGNAKLEKGIEQQTNFKNVSVNSRIPCRDCKFRYLCGGDCYYNSYLNNNNINNCENSYCDLMQYLCELAIKIVALLKENAKNYEELKRYLLMSNTINKY